jgi:PAS domain S-box-containing protein
MMTDGFGIIDKDGKTSYANPRFCEILGSPEEEVVGISLANFLNEADKIIYERQMESRRKGVHVSYEMTFTQKSGHKVHTIISPKTIVDENGNFSGSFAVITDISDRKREEETLRKEKLFSETLLGSSPAFFVVK